MLRPDEPVHALTPTRPIARLAALLRHRRTVAARNDVGSPGAPAAEPWFELGSFGVSRPGSRRD